MTGIGARFLPAAGGADRVTARGDDFAALGLDALRGRFVFAGFAAGRLRALARVAAARTAGLRDFFAVFFAARRLGAAFRATLLRAAARLRPAVFRPPLVFLPACRPAFRLAMDVLSNALTSGVAYLDSFR